MNYREQLEEALQRNAFRLVGRLSSNADCAQVQDQLYPCDVAWAIQLMSRYKLANSLFVIRGTEPEASIDIRWMTPQQILSEAKEAYPGICAITQGYFPFGADPIGTGDQFFLRCGSMEDRRVFQIYHDCVDLDANRVLDEGIQVILPDLSLLFQYARPWE